MTGFGTPSAAPRRTTPPAVVDREAAGRSRPPARLSGEIPAHHPTPPVPTGPGRTTPPYPAR
ncbi:hypothetical protein Aph02nite_47550 [Actinoplanes philippinensis]|nr:hypothetical protein Aph02nite_47550 [Actinoplanes philippinensis]